MHTHFGTARGFVTVSSTAALEAIHESADVDHLRFGGLLRDDQSGIEGSGCLGTLDDFARPPLRALSSMARGQLLP